jgi:hypothetical protein
MISAMACRLLAPPRGKVRGMVRGRMAASHASGYRQASCAAEFPAADPVPEGELPDP